MRARKAPATSLTTSPQSGRASAVTEGAIPLTVIALLVG
jgi:hypothetical protein